MIQYLNKKYKSMAMDAHTDEVIRKSIMPFFLKLMGISAGLLLSIFISRTIGAASLGMFNIAIQLGGILSVLAMLGMDQLILKQVAIAKNRTLLASIHDIVYSCFIINGGMAILATILLVAGSSWIANHFFKESLLYIPLLIIALSILPQVFSKIYSNALIGYNENAKGILSDPNMSGLFTAPILLYYYFFVNNNITVTTTVFCFLIGRIFVFFLQMAFWKYRIKKTAQPSFMGKSMLVGSGSLLVITLLGPIGNNIEVFILGFLGKHIDVGFFSVIWRLSNLLILIVLITNSALTPKVAALFDAGKLQELELMIQRFTKMRTYMGIVILLFFILLGKFILAFWGPDFKHAYAGLIVLSIGQIVNLATGSNGLLLNMCGHQKIHMRISLTSLLAECILAYFAIILLGILGAAIACSLSNICFNGVKNYYCKKKIGISIVGGIWGRNYLTNRTIIQ